MGREAVVVTAWDYGDAGDRIPVRPGELWACGPHRFACADLERDGEHERLIELGEIDIVYTDPPWDRGNARAFRTKAGDGRAVDFERLIRRVIALCRAARSEAWIEMGRRHVDDVVRWLREDAWTVLRVYDTTYYRKHPAKLVRAIRAGSVGLEIDDALIDGRDDEDTPGVVLAAAKAQGLTTVLDPCCGRGLTPATADRLGMRCFGAELNPRRLACALDRLPYDPVRIDGDQR